jgi:hypothetical protein
MLKKIILPYGYGQTCNQLLQISHWLPVAEEYGISLYFPGFRRYGHMFNGTLNQTIPCYPRTAQYIGYTYEQVSRLCSFVYRIPKIKLGYVFRIASILPEVVTISVDDSGNEGNIDPRIVIKDPCIVSGEILLVQGWLYKDYLGMAKNKQLIKKFFSPVPEIKHRLDDFINVNVKSGVVLVGVHLRRGDYRKYAGGKYYYNDDVVRGFMQQMSNLLTDKHIRFLLVSNQPIDKKNYAGFDIIIGLSDPAADLFSLARCDYIIGPPSTFTIWASFYGDVPLFMIKDSSNTLNMDGFAICRG